MEDIELLQGRVLGHGEEEGSGKRYMLLEGTDGRVYHLPQSKAVETLRSENKLRTGELLSMERSHGRLRIEELGQADQVLRSVAVLKRLHRVEVEGKRPGWLGRLDEAMDIARKAPVPVPTERTPKPEPRRVSPAPPKPEPKQNEETAVRLTEDQVRLLLASRYPPGAQRAQALSGIVHRGVGELLVEGKVEIRYSHEERLFCGLLDRRDKPAFDAKLTELVRQQQEARKIKGRDFERE